MVWTEAPTWAKAVGNSYSPGPKVTAPVVDSTQYSESLRVSQPLWGRLGATRSMGSIVNAHSAARKGGGRDARSKVIAVAMT